MNTTLHLTKQVPTIVGIVITQAVLRSARGEIKLRDFEAQLQRLRREELEPHGLTLLVRPLANGRSRFLVKHVETGAVCAMLDFARNGRLETEGSAALKDASIGQSMPLSASSSRR
jgi:hypothetical protein